MIDVGSNGAVEVTCRAYISEHYNSYIHRDTECMVDSSWELWTEVYLAETEFVRLRKGNGTSLCGSRVVINTKRGDVLFESA